MVPLDDLLVVTAPERPRGTIAEARDRSLLAAACDLRAFTTQDVVSRATHSTTQVHATHPWYSTASALLRTLHREGHLRIVSAPRVKPYAYEWVEGPDDLEALRLSSADPVRLIPALEAEVDRLRAIVGEPPLAPLQVPA